MPRLNMPRLNLPRLNILVAACASTVLLAGCSIFGGRDRAPDANVAAATRQAPSMGVNAFLWRASLETLDFMPLEQVDPFGGVIVTDYYASAEAPTERFKATVYILDTNLRADALKVSIFRQENQAGQWRDASVDADTARQIENAILDRARTLYQSARAG